jgi:peptidoglycan/LPS O-acetylase OafA/YrhL
MKGLSHMGRLFIPEFAQNRPTLARILSRRRLPALHGLRAIVILPVIIYHFGYEAPAGLSVTMFFVLSGFLITWLLLREFESTATISIRSFYLRRTLRIFPAYYAFVFVSIVADRFIATPWTGDQVLAAATYTVNYLNAFNGHDATPAPHAWSLAVEEQFYLMWPVGLLVLLKRGGLGFATVALVGCIVVAPIWRTVLYIGFDVPAHYIYNAFDTRFDTLAIGCLIALLSKRQVFAHVAEIAARHAWYPALTLSALATSHLVASQAYNYTLRFTVDSMLLGVLLLQVLLLHSTRGWRWLERPAIDYLGTISYPMYLWHTYGISVGLEFGFLPRIAQLLVSIAAMVVFAAGSYHILERPILNARPRITALLQRRRAMSAVVGQSPRGQHVS